MLKPKFPMHNNNATKHQSYHWRIDCQHKSEIFLVLWDYDALNFWKIKEI